jgi:hypothetical protein
MVNHLNLKVWAESSQLVSDDRLINDGLMGPNHSQLSEG